MIKMIPMTEQQLNDHIEKTKRRRWLKMRITTTLLSWGPMTGLIIYNLIYNNNIVMWFINFCTAACIVLMIGKYSLLSRIDNERYLALEVKPIKISKYFDYDYNHSESSLFINRKQKTARVQKNGKITEIPYIDHRKYTDKKLREKVNSLLMFL